PESSVGTHVRPAVTRRDERRPPLCPRLAEGPRQETIGLGPDAAVGRTDVERRRDHVGGGKRRYEHDANGEDPTPHVRAACCASRPYTPSRPPAGPAGRRGRPPTLPVRRRERFGQTTGAERASAGGLEAGRSGRGDRVPRPPHLARSRADAACSEGSRAPPG